MATTEAPLSAPLEVGFDYTRSLGPVLSRFMTALRDGRVEGCAARTGGCSSRLRSTTPSPSQALDEPVAVADEGVVDSWSWMPTPMAGQPLAHPFAWALVRLDGADTAMLHAVDAGSPDRMRTGMRVRVRWAAERVGAITDIACFEPVEGAARAIAPAPDGAPPVTMVTTPVHLSYQHSASAQESSYLRGLAEGRLLGQRCPECRKVYIPPRGACPTDGVPTEEEVELPDRGTVTTFCIVNVPFLGQRIKPPYVAAYVLLDGADIAFLHLVLGVAADEVRMGMRVEAAWKPREQWGTTLENIEHFRPSGEPDAPYESYAEHL